MSGAFFGRLRSGDPANKEKRPKNHAPGNDHQLKAQLPACGRVIDPFHAEEDKQNGEDQSKAKVDGEDTEKHFDC